MDESLASPENPPSADEAIGWCAAEVRRFDPDRYFTCLFAGEEGRRALVSLYAFNLEIAKIRESVSEPMLGRIRLQWWREAIEGIFAGTPRNHAVVTALADTVARHNLSRARFDRMIDGREFDLEDRPPETVEELVRYAEATSGELSCLVFEVLGGDDDDSLATAMSAGIAWALTGLIRSVPFHAAQGRCFLPGDRTGACSVSLRDLYEGRGGEPLNRVVAEIAVEARRFLDLVRGKIPRPLRAGFAPAALAAADLDRLEKSGHDVFALRSQSPAGRQWTLLKAMLRRRI